MIRLLGVELTRMRSRRAVILLVAAAVLVPGLIWAGVAWNTRPVSAAERESVQAEIEQARQDPGTVRFYERCLRNSERFGVPPGQDVEEGCDRAIMPQAEWFTYRLPLSLDDERSSSGYALIVLLSLLLVLIGTTFAGHDWNSRSMSNQLLFEPRRLRVWTAKGAAVLVTGLLVAGAVLAAYWGGLWLLAESRGIDTPARVLDDVMGLNARGFLLAGFGALGAYALTMLFRSTVATIGVLFACSLVVPLLLAVVGFDGYPRWMPHNNVAAVLNDGITYYDETAARTCPDMSDQCGMVTLSLGGGVRYFAGLMVLAVAPSLWSFRRRDVP